MAGVANTFRSPLPMSAAVFLPWTHATVASPRMPCRERQRVTAYNALLVRAAAMHRSRVLASAGTRAHVGRASFAPRSSHPARRSPASRPHARRPHVRRSAHRLDVCARGHPGPEAAVLLACALQGPPQHEAEEGASWMQCSWVRSGVSSWLPHSREDFVLITPDEPAEGSKQTRRHAQLRKGGPCGPGAPVVCRGHAAAAALRAPAPCSRLSPAHALAAAMRPGVGLTRLWRTPAWRAAAARGAQSVWKGCAWRAARCSRLCARHRVNVIALGDCVSRRPWCRTPRGAGYARRAGEGRETHALRAIAARPAGLPISGAAWALAPRECTAVRPGNRGTTGAVADRVCAVLALRTQRGHRAAGAGQAHGLPEQHARCGVVSGEGGWSRRTLCVTHMLDEDA